MLLDRLLPEAVLILDETSCPKKCDASVGVTLLITDVMMPGESGVALAAELRSRWPHIGTLFISGYSDADLPTTDALPADELLQKPFTGAQLLERVAARLRSRRPAPSVAHTP